MIALAEALAFLSFCNMKYAFKHESLGSVSPLHCAAPFMSPCPSRWGGLCQISFAQELLVQQYLWNSPSGFSKYSVYLITLYFDPVHALVPVVVWGQVGAHSDPSL